MLNLRGFLEIFNQDIVILDRAEGEYVDGKWQPGQASKREVRATVIPVQQREALQLGEAGKYAHHIRKIYVHEPLLEGQEIQAEGHTWKVVAEQDYSRYASGLRMYFVERKVSAGD